MRYDRCLLPLRLFTLLYLSSRKQRSSILATEQNANDWYESVTVRINKKTDKPSCESHKGISVVITASKLPMRVILRR